VGWQRAKPNGYADLRTGRDRCAAPRFGYGYGNPSAADQSGQKARYSKAFTGFRHSQAGPGIRRQVTLDVSGALNERVAARPECVGSYLRRFLWWIWLRMKIGAVWHPRARPDDSLRCLIGLPLRSNEPLPDWAVAGLVQRLARKRIGVAPRTTAADWAEWASSRPVIICQRRATGSICRTKLYAGL